MKELAAEFGIDRRTVSNHVRRAGIRARRGGHVQDQMIEAALLDEGG